MKFSRELVIDMLKQDHSTLDLSGLDLSGLDLSDLKLTKANLANANLVGSNLTNADLSEADLRGANLDNSILLNTVLNLAVYDYATIWPQKFIEARNSQAQQAFQTRLQNLCAELNITQEQLANFASMFGELKINPNALKIEFKALLAAQNSPQDKRTQIYRLYLLSNALSMYTIQENSNNN